VNAGTSDRAAVALYRVVRGIVYGFARLYWRLSIEGADHLPASGPYVVAPVHRSNIDTPLVAMVTPRRLRFMGKDSLWKHQPAAWFLSALGGFPVHRGSADREALRRCIEVIERGEPLVIFPEGTRREGSDVQPLFDGAAYIAGRTGVPIIPVGIGGSQRAMPRGSKGLRPAKIHLVVGPAIAPPSPAAGGRVSRRAVDEVTATLHKEIQVLFDRARAVAGD
jgi:1-acyl-sn-glycerol-3-phosphate acyltransferase